MANKIKFIQLGGLKLVAESLRAGLESQGHSVTDACLSGIPLLPIPAAQLIAALESLSDTFDCLIIHLGANSEMSALKQALAQLRTRKMRVCGLLYHQGLPDPDFRLGLDQLSEALDHLFVSNPELMPAWENCSLLACPLPLNRLPDPVPHEPELNGAKLLHIPYLSDKIEQDAVLQSLRKLNSKRDRLLYAIISPDQISSEEELELRLSECDIFVESLSNLSPGPLSLLAMALGKTVITGTQSELERRWRQLENYPAVRATGENFEKKLDGILREHRSMRDFGKRGRKFVLSCSAPETVASMMLPIVEKLLR